MHGGSKQLFMGTVKCKLKGTYNVAFDDGDDDWFTQQAIIEGIKQYSCCMNRLGCSYEFESLGCSYYFKSVLVFEEVTLPHPRNRKLKDHIPGKDGGQPLQQCMLDQLVCLHIVFFSKEQAYDVKNLDCVPHYTVGLEQVKELKARVVNPGKTFKNMIPTPITLIWKRSFMLSTTLLMNSILSFEI